MLLRSLEVENFRALREAQLTFGRGLNVLFGPNDLGKSSLVDALRAAFLLPCTSTEGRDFVPWGTDRVPRVIVVFEAKGTVWRITKTFGSGARATALLEQIRENGSSREEASGRAVDGKLREIFAWGIPGPGGKAAPRGLPESYLTIALLGRQDKVTAILEANIEADGVDSGRNAVVAALGALGQDPLVVRLLERLEEQTERVFTTTGKPRTAEDSPLVQLTNRVKKQEQRVKQLDADVCQSLEIERRVQSLTEQCTRNSDEISRLERRVELLTRIREAEGGLTKLGSAKALVEEAERALAQVDEDLRCAESRQRDATLALSKIDEAQRLARERLAKATGSLDEVRKTGEQTRQTRCAELVAKRATATQKAQSARECIQARKQVETRNAELAAAEAESERAQQGVAAAENIAQLTSLLREWHRAREAVEAVKTAEAERAQQSAAVNEAEASLKTTQAALGDAEASVAAQKDALNRIQREAAQRDIHKEILQASLIRTESTERGALQTVERLKAAHAASARLADAEKSLADLEADERELEARLTANAAERQAYEARPLAPQLLSIRAAFLAGLLTGGIAAATGIVLQFHAAVLAIAVVASSLLAVALAVVIVRTQALREANQVRRRELDALGKAREPLLERRNQLSAQRGVAQVRVDSARSERDQGLAALGERELTLEKVEQHVREARREVERVKGELATIAGLPHDDAVARAHLAAAEQSVMLLKQQVSEQSRLLDEARGRLADTQVRFQVATHSAASVDLVELEQRLEVLRIKVDIEENTLPNPEEANRRVLSARQYAVDCQTQAMVSKELLTDAQSKFAMLAAEFQQPPEQVLAETERMLEDLEKALMALDQAVCAELDAAQNEFDQTQTEATRLQEQLTAARLEAGAANLVHDETRMKCEAARRNLETLRQSVPTTDVVSTETTLAQARKELIACAGSEDLTAAEALLQQRQTEAHSTEEEIHAARGQLELVGGIVAREQHDQEMEALEALRGSAGELELEYKATRHLLDVLKEADQKHAAHLGRCLAKPVAESFLELTAGRYAEVVLDTALRLRNVAAKGAERAPASLSVGTRDQLATLVRLALADHLKSVVVLDDQLVQADGCRLVWFRERLRASARDHDHQIIVITCRPLDYLHPEEMPVPPRSKFEAEDGQLAAVALEHFVCCE